ncbi:hypothetical protein CEXT_128851 [Caerostris extrusa]|uniref:Uncharacterized protein n=1 Tax=Caerostris extrusa TaxID=172846 RepID=A0AAV4YCT5_CAEEX|nr:hypothetical protein CEXT_128851 [Caerostris extrusa]
MRHQTASHAPTRKLAAIDTLGSHICILIEIIKGETSLNCPLQQRSTDLPKNDKLFPPPVIKGHHHLADTTAFKEMVIKQWPGAFGCLFPH